MKQDNLFYGFSEADLNGYVERSLAKETLRVMEAAIQKHPELKEELIQRIHAKRWEEHPELLLWFAKRRDAQALETSNAEKESISSLKQWWTVSATAWVGAVALSVALITGGYYYFMDYKLVFSKQKAQEIANIALSQHTDRDVYADISQVPNHLLKEALTFYRKHDYSNAENAFQKFAQVHNEDDKIYIAICRLHRKEYQKARQVLRPLLDSPDTYAEALPAIRWYLSIALTGEKPSERQLQEVRKLLNEIPKENVYYEFAQDLLKKIN